MSQIVKKGLLSKRCRWSWRPRYVELTSTPSDISGPQFGYLLLIYDQSYRSVKNKIHVEDIVTIRAGKNFSFQIYLNSGMFLFFKTGSAEDQAAWMADIKMALGKGSAQFHVRVTGSSFNNLILDHALLYCVGVNLPSHGSGQSDRVLVLASPVSDVNIHAWNLSRVKRFVIIDAGIQMELCSSCVGSYQKKVITFLLPVEYISNCMTFLLHEMHAVGTQPHLVMTNGPTVYDLPHHCTVNPSPVSPTGPPPYCNDAELAVLQTQEYITKPIEEVTHPHSTRPSSSRSRHYTISTTSTQTHDFFEIPPRNIPRSSYQQVEVPPRGETNPPPPSPPQPYLNFQTEVTSHQSPSSTLNKSSFETPYHISQRIYISDNGTVTKESQILGSGSGEFRSKRGHNPVYISTEEINSPLTVPPRNIDRPLIDSNKPTDTSHRPDFIGRRRPILPPRNSSPLLSSEQRSFSEPGLIDNNDNTCDYQNLMEEGIPPPTLQPSASLPPFCVSPSPPPPPPPISPRQSPLSSPRSSPILIETQVEYVNMESKNDSFRGSNSSLCTDDITNAEFALMTKVSFSRIITPSLPPRSKGEPKPPRPLPRTKSNAHVKKPVPVPRSKTTTTTQQVTTTIQQNIPTKKHPPRRHPSPPDWCKEPRPRSLSHVSRSSSSEGSLKSFLSAKTSIVTSNEY